MRAGKTLWTAAAGLQRSSSYIIACAQNKVGRVKTTEAVYKMETISNHCFCCLIVPGIIQFYGVSAELRKEHPLYLMTV